MSENESENDQNQSKSPNSQSECSEKATSSSGFRESARKAAFNEYIVQEITVIGDRMAKECPVTDTVNERLLVIDHEHRLNELIECLSKPLNDVVLMMIKSDECINYDHEPDTSTKYDTEKITEASSFAGSEIDSTENVESGMNVSEIDKPNESKRKQKTFCKYVNSPARDETLLFEIISGETNGSQSQIQEKPTDDDADEIKAGAVNELNVETEVDKNLEVVLIERVDSAEIVEDEINTDIECVEAKCDDDKPSTEACTDNVECDGKPTIEIVQTAVEFQTEKSIEKESTDIETNAKPIDIDVNAEIEENSSETVSESNTKLESVVESASVSETGEIDSDVEKQPAESDNETCIDISNIEEKSNESILSDKKDADDSKLEIKPTETDVATLEEKSNATSPSDDQLIDLLECDGKIIDAETATATKEDEQIEEKSPKIETQSKTEMNVEENLEAISTDLVADVEQETLADIKPEIVVNDINLGVLDDEENAKNAAPSESQLESVEKVTDATAQSAVESKAENPIEEELTDLTKSVAEPEKDIENSNDNSTENVVESEKDDCAVEDEPTVVVESEIPMDFSNVEQEPVAATTLSVESNSENALIELKAKDASIQTADQPTTASAKAQPQSEDDDIHSIVHEIISGVDKLFAKHF